MQALLCSHRCVRLHTFEPEERVYTSTPTKIGGHCLDHIRNGLTGTFVQSSHHVLNDKSDHAGLERGKPPTWATFNPKGRFGGLCGVVLRLSPPPATASVSPVRPQQPQQIEFSSSVLPQQGTALTPLHSKPAELPQDIGAWKLEDLGEHGPDWPCSSTMASRDERHSSFVGPVSDRGQPNQQHNVVINVTASRHTGALMAVLLSKLANGRGGSYSAEGSVADAADAAGAADFNRTTAMVAPASLESCSELRGSLVAQVEDAASTVASCDDMATASDRGVGRPGRAKDGQPGNAGGAAWRARLDQTPSHSKLRRYSFVRELGRGAHGTVLLVRKQSANTRAGRLRVLKESHFLPEAVNEARLLLLADGHGERARVGEGERALGGDGGVGSANTRSTAAKRRFVETVGAWGAGDSSRRPGEDGTVAVRDRGYQPGGVVQMHDFFVETLGHRSFAFLELEYCEGGDLHGLMLGESKRVGGGWRQRGAERGAESVVDARSSQGTAGLPVAHIGRLALGLCEGVQQLHERGVIHRDLKPANVLLTKAGGVRIADLGVSTRLQPSRPLTESGAGTIPFMAPEVRKFLLGSKVAYSGKADAWAIGALLYAMAIGDPAPAELPTASRAELVSVVGHRTGSERLALVAHKALDPDPASRSSVHQLTIMLQDCCLREGWLPHVAVTGRHSSRRLPTAGLARL